MAHICSNQTIILILVIVFCAGQLLQNNWGGILAHSYKNMNDYQPESADNYVTIRDEKPMYGAIQDYHFNFIENAAYLKRNVNYCQWVEKNDQNGRYYTKEWTDRQINSNNYGNSYAHRNPRRDTLDETSVIQSFDVGSYRIDRSLIDPSQIELLTFVPNYTQLEAFVTSSAQRQFRYIGRGVFYSEYEPGTSSILRNYLGQDTNGKLSEMVQDELFKSCTPGDMSVFFTIFNPSRVSVSGARRGHTLYSDGTVNSYLASGDRKPFEKLDGRLKSIMQTSYFPVIAASVLMLLLILFMHGFPRLIMIGLFITYFYANATKWNIEIYKTQVMYLLILLAGVMLVFRNVV